MNNNIDNNVNSYSTSTHDVDPETRRALDAISFVLTGGLCGRPSNINLSTGGSRRGAQFKQVYYNIQADTSVYPADFKINFLLRSNSLSRFPNVVCGFPTSISLASNLYTNVNIALTTISTNAAASSYYTNGTTGGVPSLFGVVNPLSLGINFTESECGVFADSLEEGTGYESSFNITDYYDKGYVLTSNSKLSELVIQAGLAGFKGQSVFGLLEQYPPSTNLTKTRLSGGTIGSSSSFENFKADSSISIIQIGACNMRYLSNGACNPLSQTHLVQRSDQATLFSGANLNYMDISNANCRGLPLLEATSSGLYFVDTGVDAVTSFKVQGLVANLTVNFYLWADFGYYVVTGGQAELRFVTVALDARTVAPLVGNQYLVKLGGYTPNATEYKSNPTQSPVLTAKFPSFFVGLRLTASTLVGTTIAPLSTSITLQTFQTTVNVYDRDPEADLQQVAVGYYQGYVGPFTLTTTKSYYVVPNTANQVVLNTMTELPCSSTVSDCVVDICRKVALGGGFLGEHKTVTEMMHRLTSLDYLAASYHIPTYLPWVHSTPPLIPNTEGHLEASGSRFLRNVRGMGRAVLRGANTAIQYGKRGSEMLNTYLPMAERAVTMLSPLMAGGLAPYAASGSIPRQYHFPGSSESSGELMPMNPNRWLASGLTNIIPPHIKNLDKDLTRSNVKTQPSTPSKPAPQLKTKRLLSASGMGQPLFSRQDFPRNQHLTKLLMRPGMAELFHHYRHNPTCLEHQPIVEALNKDGYKVANKWMASELDTPSRELSKILRDSPKAVHPVGVPQSYKAPTLNADASYAAAYFPVVAKEVGSIMVGLVKVEVHINPTKVIPRTFDEPSPFDKFDLYVDSGFAPEAYQHINDIVFSFFIHASVVRTKKPKIYVCAAQVDVALDDQVGLIDGPSLGMALYAALYQLPLGPVYTGQYSPATDEFEPVNDLYYKMTLIDPSCGPFIIPSAFVDSPQTAVSGMSDPTLIDDFKDKILTVPTHGPLGRFVHLDGIPALVAAVNNPSDLFSVVVLNQKTWFDATKSAQQSIGEIQDDAQKLIRSAQGLLVTVAQTKSYQKAIDTLAATAVNGELRSKARGRMETLEIARKLFLENPGIGPEGLIEAMHMEPKIKGPAIVSVDGSVTKSKKGKAPKLGDTTPEDQVKDIKYRHDRLMEAVNRQKGDNPAAIKSKTGRYILRSQANAIGFIPKITGDINNPEVKAKMDKCSKIFVGDWVPVRVNPGVPITHYFFFETNSGNSLSPRAGNALKKLDPDDEELIDIDHLMQFDSRRPGMFLPGSGLHPSVKDYIKDADMMGPTLIARSKADFGNQTITNPTKKLELIDNFFDDLNLEPEGNFEEQEEI